MAQAFAYYNYDETQGRHGVHRGFRAAQVPINADTFRAGYVTPDDRWDNYWRAGQNALLGWDSALPGAGNGAKSLGQELGQQRRLRVLPGREGVPQRLPALAAGCRRPQPDRLDGHSFRSSGYRLKQVFADAAIYCMGQ